MGAKHPDALVRLDTDRTGTGTIVHCYGHGGAGATLAWGCAVEVRDRILTGGR